MEQKGSVEQTGLEEQTLLEERTGSNKQRSFLWKVTYIQSSHVFVELILPVSGKCRKNGVVRDFSAMLYRSTQRGH